MDRCRAIQPRNSSKPSGHLSETSLRNGASATSMTISQNKAMPLKPWYKVVTPREDLREGKPLDAAEFAVHLDDVRNNCAPPDYQKPDRFFARTYLTRNLSALASEVVRRLSGQRTETSAVFNVATQFGGGKTHALTLLFH